MNHMNRLLLHGGFERMESARVPYGGGVLLMLLLHEHRSIHIQKFRTWTTSKLGTYIHVPSGLKPKR
jgi:hypothetical protein